MIHLKLSHSENSNQKFTNYPRQSHAIANKDLGQHSEIQNIMKNIEILEQRQTYKPISKRALWRPKKIEGMLDIYVRSCIIGIIGTI